MEVFSQILALLQQIKDALDLTAVPARFLVENQETAIRAMQDLVLSTGDPAHPGRPLTQDPAITRFEPLAQVVANLGLVVVVIFASYRIMWSHGLRSRYTVRLMLPRILLAFVLINFALPLFQAAVDFNNALDEAVIDSTLRGSLPSLIHGLAADVVFANLTALVAVVLFAGYLLLAFVYVVRFALLVILAILSPVAALLFVLPDTHHYAREWVSLFISTLLMQPLQLLVLSVGFVLDASGLPIVKHVFALAAVFICFKVPGALHFSSTVGGHASTAVRRRLNHVVHAMARA
jgi:hypothetical protein